MNRIRVGCVVGEVRRFNGEKILTVRVKAWPLAMQPQFRNVEYNAGCIYRVTDTKQEKLRTIKALFIKVRLEISEANLGSSRNWQKAMKRLSMLQ